MANNPLDNGWRRFLDRLKRLWGKVGTAEPRKSLAGR